MILSEWLNFICNLLQIISWPIVVLIIFFFLKRPIISFVSHINEAEFPGGIKLKTIPKEIEKAESIKDRIENEPKKDKMEIPQESRVNINERMKKLGLEPSPSNLDMNYYTKIIELDPNIALAGLRIDLEIMLRNLAKGFNLETKNIYSASYLGRLLIDTKAIDFDQYQLINSIINICNAAVHGQKITKKQAIKVLEMTPVLINDYISWLYWGFKNK